MKVNDVMSRAAITIEPLASCHEALRRMHQGRIRHLPVVDRTGAPVGMVTDRDLRHHLFHPRVYQELGAVPVETLLSRVPVNDVMSAPVVCVGAELDVADAASRMLENRVGSLPVVQGGRVVGIVTETDLLRHVCRLDAACAPEVAEVVVPYP